MSKQNQDAYRSAEAADLTRTQYSEAVAEFDALWQAGNALASKQRMDELLSIIDAVERPIPFTYPLMKTFNLKIAMAASCLALAAITAPAQAQTPKAGAATKPALEVVEAKLALRELVDTFSLLADRKEARKQTELFTENAEVLTYSNGAVVSKLVGRKVIGDAFDAFLKSFDVVYHMNGQHVVDVRGNSATGELYCLTYLFGTNDGQRNRTTIGVRYKDEYKLVDGRWLISKRTSYFEWRTEEKVS